VIISSSYSPHIHSLLGNVFDKLKFTTSQASSLESTISDVVNHIRQQTALEEMSKWAGDETQISPQSVPGNLLHCVLINFFSNCHVTRRSSYVLLSQMKISFKISMSLPIVSSDSIVIPSFPLAFVSLLSHELALNCPHFTLDFMDCCSNCLNSDAISLRIKMAVMTYIVPWVRMMM